MYFQPISTLVLAVVLFFSIPSFAKSDGVESIQYQIPKTNKQVTEKTIKELKSELEAEIESCKPGYIKAIEYLFEEATTLGQSVLQSIPQISKISDPLTPQKEKVTGSSKNILLIDILDNINTKNSFGSDIPVISPPSWFPDDNSDDLPRKIRDDKKSWDEITKAVEYKDEKERVTNVKIPYKNTYQSIKADKARRSQMEARGEYINDEFHQNFIRSLDDNSEEIDNDNKVRNTNTVEEIDIEEIDLDFIVSPPKPNKKRKTQLSPTKSRQSMLGNGKGVGNESGDESCGSNDNSNLVESSSDNKLSHDEDLKMDTPNVSEKFKGFYYPYSEPQLFTTFKTSFVLKNGKLFVWGAHALGQLGLGHTKGEFIKKPTKLVIGEKTIIQIMTTWGGTFFKTSDGKLFVYGHNNLGQLGLGICARVYKPTEVVIEDKIIKLVIPSRGNTFFITDDNKLFASGHNTSGQLGLGSKEKEKDIFKPIEVVIKDKTIKQVIPYGDHTFFITDDGKLFASGYNKYGMLGIGSNKERIFKPTEVVIGDKTIRLVIPRRDSTFFITDDERVFVCGRNSKSNLGIGSKKERTFEPTEVVIGDKKIKHVISYEDGTFFITDDSKLFACGDNKYGKLGVDSKEEEIFKPIEVVIGDKKIKQVIPYRDHTFFITDDGKLLVCGKNTNNLPELGSREIIYEPTEVVIKGKKIKQATKYMLENAFFITEDHRIYLFEWGSSSPIMPIEKIYPNLEELDYSDFPNNFKKFNVFSIIINLSIDTSSKNILAKKKSISKKFPFLYSERQRKARITALSWLLLLDDRKPAFESFWRFAAECM